MGRGETHASPLRPSFIWSGTSVSLTLIVTTLSAGRSTPLNRPKRTWNGVLLSRPSGCRTAMMSMAPLRLDSFISEYSS